MRMIQGLAAKPTTIACFCATLRMRLLRDA